MDLRDQHGNPPGVYPSTFNGAYLLGINGEGLAEYYDGKNVFLAEYKDGEIQSPPQGYGQAHEVSLDAFEWTLDEYIEKTAEEKGQWRDLTPYAFTHLDYDATDAL